MNNSRSFRHIDVRFRECGLVCAGSGDDDVRRLRTLGALLDIELDGLTDLESLVQSVARAVVKENIGGTFHRYETETFVGFRLDSACSHTKKGEEGKRKADSYPLQSGGTLRPIFGNSQRK